MNEKTSADVVIITFKDEEMQGVMKHFPKAKSFGGEFLSCYVDEAPYQRIAICQCAEQGQSAAQVQAVNVINEFTPAWIFAVGICGGFPSDDFTLGDILVSSRILDFSVTSQVYGEGVEQDVRGLSLHRDALQLVSLMPTLSQPGRLPDWYPETPKPAEPFNIKKAYGDKPWKEKVAKAIAILKERQNPKVTFVPVASSNILLKDPELAQIWKDTARSLHAVEMELAGIAYAATYNSLVQPRVIGIRGVSDIVGYKRDSAWTKYAAECAGAFTATLVKHHSLKKNTENLASENSIKHALVAVDYSSVPTYPESRTNLALRTSVIDPLLESEISNVLGTKKLLYQGRFPIRGGKRSALLWVDIASLFNYLEEIDVANIIDSVCTRLREVVVDNSSIPLLMVGVDAIGSLIAGMIGPSLGIPVITTAVDGDVGETQIFRKVDEKILEEYVNRGASELLLFLVTDILRTGASVSAVASEFRKAGAYARKTVINYQIITLIANNDQAVLEEDLHDCQQIWTCYDQLNFLIKNNSDLPTEDLLPYFNFAR